MSVVVGSSVAPEAGPRGGPVVGCLREFRSDLLGFLERCATEHGDFVPVRVVFHRGFLISDPALVGEVLTKRNQDFRKVFMLRNNRLFLGAGLLTSEGEQWRHERRLAQPAFHADRLASHATVMVEEADRTAREWRHGEVRDIQQEMMRLTLRTVVRCLFDSEAPIDFDRIAGNVETIQTRMQERLNALVPLPDTVWTPRNVVLRRAIHELDATVHGFIRHRRATGTDGPDLISTLLRASAGGDGALTDRQLRDEVMTMFFAGHETTALALTWSWYLLSEHPVEADRLEREVDGVLGGRLPTASDLPALEAVGRVVKEAMRLYPPVYAFGRDAIRATTIGGHRIPAGASAVIAPWVLHRDGRVFAEPTAFRPDRWTGEFERRLPRFAYCPFGGGARMCIGKGFAMTEAVLVLATLVQRFRAHLVPGHPVELWPTFTLRARHGLAMTLQDRLAAPRPPGELSGRVPTVEVR